VSADVDTSDLPRCSSPSVRSQTAVYASGAGLGASKGKEIGKYQEGYAGYVNMVKDSVSYFFRSCPSSLDL
jgi:hypothetical protein